MIALLFNESGKFVGQGKECSSADANKRLVRLSEAHHPLVVDEGSIVGIESELASNIERSQVAVISCVLIR